MELSHEPRYWRVTVTVSGEPMEPLMVRAALLRLAYEHPFMDSTVYTDREAELVFLDQGEKIDQIAQLATTLWEEHRVSAGLPDWEVLGVEVVENGLFEARQTREPDLGSLANRLPRLL